MLKLICVICMELFNETDDVYVTQCGHIFHHACLCVWFNSSRTCPQCRIPCTNANIHKVYLASALENSENVNLRVLGAGTTQDDKQALELYEEVNLNLKRDLEMSETSLCEYKTKLCCLDIKHKRVQDDLKKEIEMRENSEIRIVSLQRDELRLTQLVNRLEIEHKEVQKDLKLEIIQLKTNLSALTKKSEKQVAGLESDILSLTRTAHRSKLEHNQMQNDLTKEIERRKNSEKQVAQLERDKLRLMETLYKLESRKENHLVSCSNSGTTDFNLSTHVDAAKSLTLKKDIAELQKKCDAEEKKSLKTEALLFGIPQLPDENIELIFHHLCLTIDYTPPTLKAIFRSRQESKTDSPIIMKFGTPQEKNAILKAIADHYKKVKRQLCLQDFGITSDSTKRIYMRESLTSRNYSLFEQALCMKRRKQLFSVYTRFGSVYVKQSSKEESTLIENEEMLNALAARCQTGNGEE